MLRMLPQTCLHQGNWAQKRPCEPREVKKERYHLFAVWHHHSPSRASYPIHPSYGTPSSSELLPTFTNGGEKLFLSDGHRVGRIRLPVLLACAQLGTSFFFLLSHPPSLPNAGSKMPVACCRNEKNKRYQPGDTMPTSSTSVPETEKYPLPAGHLSFTPQPMLSFHIHSPPFASTLLSHDVHCLTATDPIWPWGSAATPIWRT